MPVCWRIVKSRYADTAFDGEGARLYGGRWNSPGAACVYTSESIALCLLEMLVHTESAALLPAYALIRVSFDVDYLSVLDTSVLGDDWASSPPPASTQAIGDAWLASDASAVLEVPSAIVGFESNFLINPEHPDFGELDIDAPEAFPVDARLAR